MRSFGLDIIELHDSALLRWHAREDATASPIPVPMPLPPPGAAAAGESALVALITSEHFANYSIWRLEDQARRVDVSDHVIAGIKRAIDPWNQRRNDLMEQIDLAVLESLGGINVGAAEQHSETAAMMLDRLSILSLKIRNMDAAASAADASARALRAESAGAVAPSDAARALAEQCRAKLAILWEQRDDLARCVERLIDDFRAGRRFFKMYRQMKAYNDPQLNSALRAAAQQRDPRGPRQ